MRPLTITSKKDNALRQTAAFLIAMHAKMPDGELKNAVQTHINLCCVVLPNCYLFTTEELKELRGES